MSDQSEAGHLEKQEIIIVRRGRGGEDAHHGGVWKIAFADFMTAMMAFFLVMWLTNSSEIATRKQVAQYFNPIKLNDPSPATRGIKEKDDGADRESNENGESIAETNGDPRGHPVAGDETGGEEKALFRDPYAVLAEIAAESNQSGTGAQKGKPDGSGLPGMNGGDAYRDPFDPESWQLTPNVMESGGRLEELPPIEFRTAVVPNVDPMTDREDAGPGAGGDENDGKGPGEGEDLEKKGHASNGDEIGAPAAKGPNPDGEGADKGNNAGEGVDLDEAEKLKAEIDVELAKLGDDIPSRIEVTKGDGGVKISLADDVASGMFPVGSAKPTPEAVAMMERIAAVISKQPGEVRISGHTDSRPFKSEDYDNWRLSTARAHMAYYMLARGGLDEERVTSIEGFADRKPRDADNPEAPINRRIEIFLTETKA